MKRKVVSFSTIALVMCAGMNPVAALAQTTEKETTEQQTTQQQTTEQETTEQETTEQRTGDARCPAVQMIAINDVNDSALGQSDSGFLSTVAAPVLASANDDSTSDADLDGGFTAPAKTSTSATSEQDSDSDSDVWGDADETTPSSNGDWKPDVWGDAEAEDEVTPTASASDDWKPSAWDEDTTTSAAADEPEDKESTQESSGQTSTTAQTSATAATTTTSAAKAPSVGRTIIEVESTDDTRAYLPGVTGPDTVPAYDESISTAMADVETVLEEIDTTCPNTKIVLLGVGQGAHAASTVSKRIGAGEVFPADKVLGVSLFADPSRAEDQPVVANGADAPAGAQQSWDAEQAPGAGVATVREDVEATGDSDYGSVADRTVSWCAEGDTTCALPADTPLRTVVANTAEGTEGKAPEHVLRHVTDVLAPAVVLGSVETLASDVEFGPGGFTFNRAASADSTLIGRVAAESDRQVPQDEMQERLLSAGMQIGGMALAAGVTVAKEVVQPHNVAQIATAASVSPAAGVGTALVIAGAAAGELVSEQTMTTGAARLADEAKAFGVDDEGLAQAAVQAAVGSEVSKSTGAYSTSPSTASGASAASATTDWLLDIVGAELGRPLSAKEQSAPATYDTAAVEAALQEG